MTVPVANLLEVVALNAARRMDRANELWAALSDREKLLVKEAAVMGYVRGAMWAAPSSELTVPRDSVIVAEVVQCCDGMADKYPTIAQYVADEEEGEEA